MRRLGLLLCLVLLARADDDPKAPALRIYDIADLKQDDASLAAAMTRVKAAADGHEVRLEKNCVVVLAPPAVHEKIAKELAAVRAAFGKLVTMELRIVKVEGGLPAASIPADKVDALLKEKRAEGRRGPTLTCFNGQQASVTVLRQVSYISDFDISVDGQGNVTADPEISTIDDGLTAKLRPFLSGQTIRVAVDLSFVEVSEPIPEVELPIPLATPVKIQVPECKSCSVARLVECAPGAFTVIDLGGGHVVLLLAIPALTNEKEIEKAMEQAEQEAGQEIPGQKFPGQEIPLKQEPPPPK
jgi:hypothetical protein